MGWFDGNKGEQLLQYLKTGETTKAHALLNRNPRMKLSAEQARECISNCVMKGYINLLKKVLKLPRVKPGKKHVFQVIESINLRDASENSQKKAIDILEVLFAKGVIPGDESVRMAAANNLIGVLERLLKAGGDPCGNRHSPLNIAVERGHYLGVQVLLRYGESANNVKEDILKTTSRLAEQGNANAAAVYLILQGGRIG